MSRNGKVVVAMSGGVDSSVAACLLKEQGYDCIGVFMRIGAGHDAPAAHDACALTPGAGPADHAAAPGNAPAVARPRRLRHGCCSSTDAVDARAIAARLGIPFYALNFQPDFEPIIDYFVDEYRRARTPNPCVMCNIHLKFGKLLRYADLVDAQYVATGHYARILPDPQDGAPRLARAVHEAKDQSYVLFGIRRPDLARCLFPIGLLPDKAAVRDLAARLDLRVHDKPDSQEICFVPGNDYRALIQRRAPEALRPGEIRDEQGRVLARHNGVAGFTIGQRRGLGLAVGLPVYVTRIDAASGAVTVGGRDALLAGGLVARDVNWLAPAPCTGERRTVEIRIRHMHAPARGNLLLRPDGAVEARFDQPQPAVTPGQAAVFYEGPLVLGGGWIDAGLPVGA